MAAAAGRALPSEGSSGELEEEEGGGTPSPRSNSGDNQLEESEGSVSSRYVTWPTAVEALGTGPSKRVAWDSHMLVCEGLSEFTPVWAVGGGHIPRHAVRRSTDNWTHEGIPLSWVAVCLALPGVR